MKRCSKCRNFRPLADFGRDGSRADGLHGHCRKCRRQRTLTLRASPEHVHFVATEYPSRGSINFRLREIFDEWAAAGVQVQLITPSGAVQLWKNLD